MLIHNAQAEGRIKRPSKGQRFIVGDNYRYVGLRFTEGVGAELKMLSELLVNLWVFEHKWPLYLPSTTRARTLSRRGSLYRLD